MAGAQSRAQGRVGEGGARRNEAGAETRTRLLDAAERLFATRGLDAVSVRDITVEAAANTAAIHYHFGSKPDLVEAIVQRRAGVLGTRRTELLDELETVGDVTLPAVVRAMILPTAEMADDGAGGRYYVAFLAALGDHPEVIPTLASAYDAYTDRFWRLLVRLTPELPDDVRHLRWSIAKDLVNRLLGDPTGQVHQWLERHSPGADADLVGSLTDIIVGMFEAPVTAAPTRRTGTGAKRGGRGTS